MIRIFEIILDRGNILIISILTAFIIFVPNVCSYIKTNDEMHQQQEQKCLELCKGPYRYYADRRECSCQQE